MDITKDIMERVEKNLLFKRYVEIGIRENLFSDLAGALGYMHSQLIKCAYPELIGRKIIAVRKTKEPAEKFPMTAKPSLTVMLKEPRRVLAEKPTK